MNRSKLASAGIGKRGVRRQEVALQPGIGVVTFAGKPLTVRANLVGRILAGQKFCYAPPNQRTAFTPQQMAEPLIASQDASLPIVNQDRITDRVERVLPLLLNGIDLLEQADVLERHSQQVGNIQQVGKL